MLLSVHHYSVPSSRTAKKTLLVAIINGTNQTWSWNTLNLFKFNLLPDFRINYLHIFSCFTCVKTFLLLHNGLRDHKQRDQNTNLKRCFFSRWNVTWVYSWLFFCLGQKWVQDKKTQHTSTYLTFADAGLWPLHSLYELWDYTTRYH